MVCSRGEGSMVYMIRFVEKKVFVDMGIKVNDIWLGS